MGAQLRPFARSSARTVVEGSLHKTEEIVMKRPMMAALSSLLICVAAAHAFNGHKVTDGPLQLFIGPIASPTDYDAPTRVDVSLKSLGAQRLEGTAEIRDLVDQWYVVGAAKHAFKLPGKGERRLTFRVAAAKGAYSAHYPVHVYVRFTAGGAERTAHAVQIVKTEFKRQAKPAALPAGAEVNVAPARGGLPLWTLRNHRVAWQYFEQPISRMPAGWSGSVAGSRGSFRTGNKVTRGESKWAINMHPPWTGGTGTIFAEYRVKLPKTHPIKLSFANAIRDHSAKEPPSDGVTFRVWAGEGRDATKLFQRHTASKVWVPGEADLSAFAGQTILLRLESHPGPKRDTTCDSSYWGEPAVVVGLPPSAPRPEARQRAMDQLSAAARKVSDGAQSPEGVHSFAMDDGAVALLKPGRQGIIDAVLAFGCRGKAVAFDGVRVDVLDQPVGPWVSRVSVLGCEARAANGRLWLTHRLQSAEEQFDFRCRAWAEGTGLRVKFDCPKRITDIRLGPASQTAPRVYFGHGYCVVNPKPFRVGFGGHSLSASHVGFDFDRGLSLLTACDNPPDFLEVHPGQRTYALHTHHNATLTLVPGAKGAFDCAVRYRPLYDKKPAGGVRRLAGRFTFDIWGGRYAEIAETMEKMIRYGCTDSVLTVHNWQRWGYDYRLPDIFPPNPRFGTIEDMNRIADVCARHDIPWGLHDNYIDIYPDATDFSYRHVYFHRDGRPHKAWINQGRDAQSYKFRPDHIMPFVQRNLRLIKPALRPTHYFIDVFTSAPPRDCYDWDGKFHSALETRRCWGQAFAWIRDFLGGNAPTTSEAGHDQLTGYLDGADCQHLRLNSKRERFTIYLPCEDWARVPWFDAVLHDKFILHGVGYSGRYQGGRSRAHHGILSDDYISDEILTGHAPMVDRGCWRRGAVRKYWLMQDFVRAIALKTLRSVEFVGGDIHHLIVRWNGGATVWVNRGETDWRVEGRTLPQYGYVAKSGSAVSAVERIDGVIVESADGPNGYYANARVVADSVPLPLRLRGGAVRHLGGRAFALTAEWQAESDLPNRGAIFVHVLHPRSRRRDKIAFQGDYAPRVPTEKWKAALQTGAWKRVEIPSEWGPGEYEVVIGLHSRGSGRWALQGDDDGTRRYRLGKLLVKGNADKVSGIGFVPAKPKRQEPIRVNYKKVTIDFGPVTTNGAVRIIRRPNGLRIVPLPECPPFVLTMDAAALLRAPAARRRALSSARALDEQGRPTGQTVRGAFSPTGWTFQFDGRAFAYDVGLAAATEQP